VSADFFLSLFNRVQLFSSRRAIAFGSSLREQTAFSKKKTRMCRVVMLCLEQDPDVACQAETFVGAFFISLFFRFGWSLPL